MKVSKTKLGAANALVPEPKGKDPRSSSKRFRPNMARRQQALNHALEAYSMSSLFAGEKEREAHPENGGGLSTRSWWHPNHMDVPQKTRIREPHRPCISGALPLDSRANRTVGIRQSLSDGGLLQPLT
jgi:hypothetical protein